MRSTRLLPHHIALSKRTTQAIIGDIWPYVRIGGRYRLSNEIARTQLLCRAQRRTKITQFVIDLVRFFDSLSNFFAEQRAIAFAQ